MATATDSINDKMVIKIAGSHKCQKSPSSNKLKKLTGSGKIFYQIDPNFEANNTIDSLFFLCVECYCIELN